MNSNITQTTIHPLHTVRTLFFDFDGTLADTAPAITDAAYKALKQWGMPENEIGDASRIVGPPFPGAFSYVYGVSSEDDHAITSIYKSLYLWHNVQTFPLFNHMKSVLDSLLLRGYSLYIASSKSQEKLDYMTEQLGIKSKFIDIVGKRSDNAGTKVEAINYLLKTYEINPAAACMIGDRLFDIEAAKACGLPCIGTPFGMDTEQELIAAGAITIVKDPEDLLSIFVNSKH